MFITRGFVARCGNACTLLIWLAILSQTLCVCVGGLNFLAKCCLRFLFCMLPRDCALPSRWAAVGGCLCPSSASFPGNTCACQMRAYALSISRVNNVRGGAPLVCRLLLIVAIRSFPVAPFVLSLCGPKIAYCPVHGILCFVWPRRVFVRPMKRANFVRFLGFALLCGNKRRC